MAEYVQWVEGTFLERPHRFMIRAQTEQGVVEAHCPNSGSLKDVCCPGANVLLGRAPSSIRRKLSYTWHWVQDRGAWVGINTQKPNVWVGQALQSGTLEKVCGKAPRVHREVVAHHSRLDFLVNGTLYIEVKSVHWRSATSHTALFPDGVTTRGLKHIHTLIDRANNGFRAMILFVIQRQDCTTLAPAWEIDPAFAQQWAQLEQHNVQHIAYDCYGPYDTQVGLRQSVPIDTSRIKVMH